MKKGYNLYNLVENFKKWLVAEKTAKGTSLSRTTLKNYTSDLRHFLGWSVFKLKIKNSKFKIDQLPLREFIPLIDKTFIEEYKQYLVSNKIPLKTVNRRLSTLRKFFSFCIDQGWIEENPAKRVKNVVSSIKNQVLSIKKEKSLIEAFKEYLVSVKKLPEKQIPTILTDVKEFLSVSSIKY